MINNEIFERNITILQNKSPQLVERLYKIKKIDEKKYKLIQTKNDLWTLEIEINQQSYLLHSKYDPEKESNALIERLIQDNYDVIFIGGFGLGYFIKSLFSLKNNNFSKLLIIEKDLNILKLALEIFDFSNILQDDKHYCS